jgi:uncharacterized membrane protein YgcG
MLGHPGQNPIDNGDGPGRMIAIAAAVLLTLGGGYYAWFGGTLPDLGSLTFSAAETRPAQATPASPAPAKIKIAPVIEPRSTYVIDGARVFTRQGLIDLNARLSELNVSAGPQLVVMTVPDLGGAPIHDYALRIANQWGIGDAERNDGVLVLIAPNQKQVRIEVGKGLTSVISDAEAKRIINTDMMPHFRAGKIDAAAVAGADALSVILRAHPTIGKD